MENLTTAISDDFATYWAVVQRWAEFEAAVASGRLAREQRPRLVLDQALSLLREHQHENRQLCFDCEHVTRAHEIAERELHVPPPGVHLRGWPEVAKRFRRLARATRKPAAWRRYAVEALRADDHCWVFTAPERFELILLASTPPR